MVLALINTVFAQDSQDAAITRLVGGTLLLEQKDEWQLQRRYLQLESLQSLADNHPARLSALVS
jgi:putative transposase